MTGILSALGAATALDISIVFLTIVLSRAFDNPMIGGKEDLVAPIVPNGGGVPALAT